MNRPALMLTLPVLVIACYAVCAAPRIRIDGFFGEPFEIFWQTDTQYAEDYSHLAFKRIEVGMTEQQVLAILGEPLYRWMPYGGRSTRKRFPEKAHFVGLVYSRSPTSKHYRLRQINLDNGVVAEIRGYFYVD